MTRAVDHDVRVAAARSALRFADLSGHPDVPWSVVLDAELTDTVDPEAVTARLSHVFAGATRLGLLPVPRVAGRIAYPRLLRAFAVKPYRPDQPLVRVLVSSEGTPRLGVIAHHGVLDGLGLLRLLATALGEKVESSAHGLDPNAPARRGFVRSTAVRMAQAVFAPTLRVQPSGGRLRDRRERLLRRGIMHSSFKTAELAAASVGAIQDWNAALGVAGSPVTLTVGTSLRSGKDAELENASSYLLIQLAEPDVERAEEAIRSARREPTASGGGALAALAPAARPVARILAPRMGSTAVVSNLGEIFASQVIQSLAFFPVAHGRSGVAIGAAGVAGRTTVTLRCRAADFSEDAGRRLLALLHAHLAKGSP